MLRTNKQEQQQKGFQNELEWLVLTLKSFAIHL